jgi:dihydroorotate dehydrogenase
MVPGLTYTHKEFIMSKFTHAGVSKQNGEFKVRFCNDALRIKVLAKNGHKDIDIIELREPMEKADAVAYLIGINFDNGNTEVRAALEAGLDKRTPKVKPAVAVKPAKAPKAAKTTPSMDAIAARAKAVKAKAAPKSTVTKAQAAATATPAATADLEDAPY